MPRSLISCVEGPLRGLALEAKIEPEYTYNNGFA